MPSHRARPPKKRRPADPENRIGGRLAGVDSRRRTSFGGGSKVHLEMVVSF